MLSVVVSISQNHVVGGVILMRQFAVCGHGSIKIGIGQPFESVSFFLCAHR